MQVASVIGREFAFRLLQKITGMREDLKSHLLNLQGLEFIYEKSLFPEPEYIFKHALTQEVAYNSLLLKRRRRSTRGSARPSRSSIPSVSRSSTRCWRITSKRPRTPPKPATI